MTPLSLFMSRFVPLLRRLRLVSRCAFVALVLVAALTMSSGLAACSGAGAAAGATASGAARASARPTRSAAASPSPSDLPTLSPELAALREEALGMEKPKVRAAMSEDTREGAASAAGYFMDLYRYTFLTGDVGPIEAISDRECIFCNSIIDNTTAAHEAGSWFETWDQDITLLRVYEQVAGASALQVDVTVSMGEMFQRTPSGEVVDHVEPLESAVVMLAMQYKDGSWHVREGQVSEP